MNRLNILLFPTRFYPAISGGDFLLERLGREFLRISKRSNRKNSEKQEINLKILTTNAIDFGSLRGNGRIVEKNHRFYSSYKNLDIYRYNSQDDNKKKSVDSQNQEFFLKLNSLIEYYLPDFNANLNSLIENGPLLPDLIDDIFYHRIDKKIPFKPHIIHCTYFPYLNIFYSLLIAKYFDIPAVITPFLHFANTRYQNTTFYSILKIFDEIFACTQYEKKKLMSYGIDEEKISVIPMGVDADKFINIDYTGIFRNIFSPKKPMLLFCGYKNYEKGALTLLKTIPYLEKKLEQGSVVFIGPSTTAFNYEFSTIKKEVKKIQLINISPDNLTGMYDKKKIGAFQMADIYCMPSRSDAYGIAYLEAWATKTPVIAAKIPAMKEVVNNNKDGFLVDFDNVNELYRAILYLLENPSLGMQMGIEGQKKVLRENDWTKIAFKTLQKYQKLIK